MLRCLHCGDRLNPIHKVCPACGPDARPDELPAVDHRLDDLTPVARFRNAAEAGFFAHELQQDGYQVYLITEDDFDAMHGFWSTRFVLSAPRQIAETVSGSLQRLLGRSDEEWEAAGRCHSVEHSTSVLPYLEDSEPEQASSGVHWFPLLLTITTGSLVFWGIKHFNPPRVAQAAGGNRENLWEEVSRSSQPWVQESKDGSRRSLSYQPQAKSYLLREDRDGDGVYEREVIFQQPRD